MLTLPFKQYPTQPSAVQECKVIMFFVMKAVVLKDKELLHYAVCNNLRQAVLPV